MSTDFSQLIADIEQEAREEGPQAIRELEQFREEFSLASQMIQSRKEGQLSQRELAKLSGVPQSEISRIETGAGNPTYATNTALLRPLGKRLQLVDDGAIAVKANGVRARAATGTGSSSKAAKGRKPSTRKASTPRGRSTSSRRVKGAAGTAPAR